MDDDRLVARRQGSDHRTQSKSRKECPCGIISVPIAPVITVMIIPIVVVRDIVGDVSSRIGALVYTVRAALLSQLCAVSPFALPVAPQILPACLVLAALGLPAGLGLAALGLSVAALGLSACLVPAALGLSAATLGLPLLARSPVLKTATEATIGALSSLTASRGISRKGTTAGATIRTLSCLTASRGISRRATTPKALLDRCPATGTAKTSLLTRERKVGQDQGQCCR